MAKLRFRRATAGDLTALVRLLADDELGREREKPGLPLDKRYIQAFMAIAYDHHQQLIVAVEDEALVGCMQLTLIPGLTRLGMWRGQIEGVRVAARHRGRGIGQKMLEHAINICREHGCGLVQLTTDKIRDEAKVFYEKLGFVASHEGMKLGLD